MVLFLSFISRTCETVMRALRDTTGDVVLTVLEVFLWDPLYEWEVTKKRQAEDMDNEELAPVKALGRKKASGMDKRKHEHQEVVVESSFVWNVGSHPRTRGEVKVAF